MTVLRRRTSALWRVLSGAVRVATPPGQPLLIGAVTPSSASAVISWLPGFSGGSAVTGYTVVASPGGTTATAGPTTFSYTMSGLTNGTAYTFTVTATNAVGVGQPSVASAPVTPSASALIRRDATNTGVTAVFDPTLGRNLAYTDLTVPTPNSTILGPSTTGGTDHVKVDASGNITIARPGFTLYRYSVLGEVKIQPGTDNVTISQCRLRVVRDSTQIYCIRWRLQPGPAPKGLTILDTEMDGQGYDGTPDPNYPNGPKPYIPSGWVPVMPMDVPDGFTWQRVNSHGFSRGQGAEANTAATPILIEDCFIHDFKVAQLTNDITHNGGSQNAGPGGDTITIRRNTFHDYDPASGWPYATSSIGSQFGGYPLNADGTKKAIVRNILWEDNYLDGGAYGFNCSLTTALQASNIVFRRNRIGLHLRFGPRAGFQPSANGYTAVWEANNVWDVSGTPDYSTHPVLAGQIIP